MNRIMLWVSAIVAPALDSLVISGVIEAIAGSGILVVEAGDDMSGRCRDRRLCAPTVDS